MKGDSYRVTEPARPPAESVIFAALAMLPILAGVVAFAVLGEPARAMSLRLTMVWASGILAFLAGVRRGLSFRSPGGADWREIATSLALFGFAFAALALTWPTVQALLLLAGYASVGVLDARAANRREAPPFFAVLRPAQVMAPVLSLLALLFILGMRGR